MKVRLYYEKNIKNSRGGLLVCFLLAGAFSSCAKKIPTDSAYSKLRDALESSLQYKTYYIQEMITHDKLLDKTTVNLRCELDKNYQPILKNGRLSDYKAEIHFSKNDLAVADIFAVFQNPPLEKKGICFSVQNTKSKNGKSKAVSKTMQAMPVEKFIEGNEFKNNYSIEHFLSELNGMTEADFHFSADTAIAESKNHLTVIGFSITDGYLQRYEKEKGKKSVFAGSDRIEIELIYGRIASVVTFCSYSDKQFHQTFEESPYKLFITYYGPKFEIPHFDSKTDQNALEWTQI